MISASIVTYKNEIAELISVINNLLEGCVNRIYIIDNSPANDLKMLYEIFEGSVDYHFIEGNVGFGAGHNVAIKKALVHGFNYHIVLNADVHFESQALIELISYIKADEEIGLIMPRIVNIDGSLQLLPKLLPSPFDILIRVIQPLKKIFSKRSKSYVLADYSDFEANVPIISGCFGIFNTKIFSKVGFYDERFFLYFEDFDFSRRIHLRFKTIYYPRVSITHAHGRGAAKKFKLFIIFLRSAIYYFQKYGWFFDKDRKKINRKVQQSIRIV